MKTTNKNIDKLLIQKNFLQITGIFLLLTYIGLSIQGILIALVVFLLIGSTFFRLDSVGLYLILILGLANISRLFGVRIDLIVIVGTIFLGVVAAKFRNQLSFRDDRRFLKNLLFVLISILAFSKRFVTNDPLTILIEYGYDQVGHFAMTMALSTGNGFLPSIDPLALTVPVNYLYYPHQWHIFASLFVNPDGFGNRMWAYLFALLVTFFISAYFIRIFITKCFSQTATNFPKKKSRNEISQNHIKRLLILGQAPTMLFFIIVMNMGYPNFAFSVSLIILSLIFFSTNLNSFTLSVIAIYFAVSTYTLFLVPSSILVFTGGLLVLRNVSRIEKIFLSIVIIFWVGFAIKIVLTSLSKSHLEYIDIGGGALEYGVLIITLFSLTVFILGLRLKLSRVIEFSLDLKVLNFVNLVLLINLIGLNSLTSFLGQGNGYYVRKFSYLVFMISLLTLFLNWFAKYVAKGKRGWITESRLQLLLRSGIPLIIVWTMIPSFSSSPLQKINSWIPFTSPFRPSIELLEASDVKELRIQEIQKAAKISRATNRPILVLSDNSAPDTQWVNSISGHWSRFLNDFLEDDKENELQFRDKLFQKSIAEKVSIYQAMSSK